MKNIAVITARGGSKRILKKNIKEFMGIPMIQYAIKACFKSDLFDEVIVSTDCPEIAQIARQLGVNVPFMRSEKASDDFATTYDVLEEVILEYKKLGENFENLCCIYPCVPFLKEQTLKNAFEQMIENQNEALIPVCKYSAPIEWAMKIENNTLVPNDREAQNMRSQDIKPKYFDAGMFYYIQTEVLLKEKTLVPSNTGAYVIDESQCQDIDTPEDWTLAEMKYRLLNE
jgi:N-acylneuraminate cytidylyltransferase